MSSVQSLTTSRQSYHRYACARCRSRKVKCDKVLPTCIYCREAGLQCAYLARRPRNSSKLTQKPATQRPLLPAEEDVHIDVDPEILDELQDDAQIDGDADEDLVIPREIRESMYEARSTSNQSEKGRLFVDQGKSRYINGDKAQQVANLESILFESKTKKEEANRPSPLCLKVNHGSNHGGNLLLRTLSHTTSLQSYHPSPDHMNLLWKYYVHNVDVLVKVVYKPSAEMLVIQASTDPGGLSPSAEAFLFSIWFAAVAAMSSEECLQIVKAERTSLLTRYKNALEQALVQAGWISSRDILVLQALRLYIGFNHWRDSHSLWMLSGIALSIAQAMGMHSDSASFCLSTIETEVRRRVWWSLCQVDVHISEECGLEPHVPLIVDTKLPLHINDSDLLQEVGTIVPRSELTEMTPSLAKIELAEMRLRVKRLQYGGSHLNTGAIESLVKDTIRRYEDTYLSYLNETSYVGRLCHLGARIIIAKLWKMQYDLSQRGLSSEKEESIANEGLMLYNANVLEITHQFPGRSDQFGWYFHCKHSQWHAMAYLLIELCKAPQNPAADRAWAVLDVVFTDAKREMIGDAARSTSIQKHTTSSVLWLPMLKLYERACEIRKSVLQTSPDSGYDTSAASPLEEFTQEVRHEDGLLGDPFFGSAMEFGENMSWEQLDIWLQSFQSDLLDSEESLDTQMNDHTDAFSW